MRKWIAIGLREHLTFKQLAKRAGVNERTLRRWSRVYRPALGVELDPEAFAFEPQPNR
jgi:hypothetical protein